MLQQFKFIIQLLQSVKSKQFRIVGMVKIIEGYILSQAIGQGNFGLVYRATHKQKVGVYAVKVIPIQKFLQNETLQVYTNSQIEALQTVGVSDYIIRFYQMIKSKNNTYFVYEYCNGGTLMNLIKKQQRIQEKKAILIFKQLLEAFKILNKNNIMHRDLKPENIFFTSSNSPDEGIEIFQGDSEKKKVKLGDFGFCLKLKPDQNLAKTMLGSPIYMAPQILKGEAYSTKADIWSLGVILFEMIYGYCPFESRSIANLINTIDTQAVQIPLNIPVSEKTQNLIRRMLTKDYFRRIGWIQLFGIKINQNGQYIEDLNSSNQERRSNSGNKGFTSLFGSMSFQTNSVNFQNHRSSSSMKNEEIEKKNNQSSIGRLISKKSIEILNRQQNKLSTQNYNGEINQSSQLKNEKKFYSQNYMSILSTPLSLKKIEDEENRSTEKGKISQIGAEISKVSLREEQNQTNRSPQKIGPSSPLLPYRSDRVALVNAIDETKVQSSEYRVGSNNSTNVSSQIEPIPFNKYRENIGMGSSLYAKLVSDKNIKDQSLSSMQQMKPIGIGSQLIDVELKRSNLLKIHESITKTLHKTMLKIEQKVLGLRLNRNLQNFKTYLQDCYIILKIVQQKLKNITECIKITETSLLDMASIVNYEHIQVEKFLIEVRNELLRFSIDIPVLPMGLSNGKVNGGLLRECIKNEDMMRMIQECI